MNLYRFITSLADKVLPRSAASLLRTSVRSRRDRSNRSELERRKKTWHESSGSRPPLLIEVESGVVFAAYTDSECCRLIFLGGYELNERQFVRRFLKPGDVFVDVGANVGLYSLMASRVVGPTGQVLSFEPCATTYARLLDNIQRNKMNNIEARRVAVSDSDGDLEFSVSIDGFDAWNSAGKPTAGTKFRMETVPCETWDSIVKREHLWGRVALMKVDIEGWESRFLTGGWNSLACPDAPTLLMELNDEAAEAAGTSVKVIRGQLTDLGFELYAAGDSAVRLARISDTSDAARPLNVIALKSLDAVVRRIGNGKPDYSMR